MSSCAADHAGSKGLATHAFSQIITYGFHQDSDIRIEVEPTDSGAQIIRLHKGNSEWCEFPFSMPGHHNAQNATAAAIVASLNGVHVEQISNALSKFQGVRRRMEIFHESEGQLFIDDFAHHPTAIKGTIDAAKQRWPDRSLTVLVEPRSNTMATNEHQNQLPDALKGADRVIIGPIFRAESI